MGWESSGCPRGRRKPWSLTAAEGVRKGEQVSVGWAVGPRDEAEGVAGLVDPALAPTLGPVVDLGGQDVGQVAEVARPAALGHLGQALCLGPHGG